MIVPCHRDFITESVNSQSLGNNHGERTARHNTGDFTYVFSVSQLPEKWKNPPKMCLKSWKLGSYCSIEADWEGLQLSAAKTRKSSLESTRDERKGGTMHGVRAQTPSSRAFVLSRVGPTLKLWELGNWAWWGKWLFTLLQSLSFWSHLHIKLVLHSRVSNEF